MIANERQNETRLLAASQEEKSVVIAVEDEAKQEQRVTQNEANRQPIPELAIRSRFSAVGTIQIMVMPLLFVNAVRRFFEFRPYLLEAIQKIKYYTCNLHPEVITAISYDGATVSAEGFGLTTTLVFLTIAESVALLSYQLVRYGMDRKKINELIQLVKQHNFENTNDIRYLQIDPPQLNELLYFLKHTDQPESVIRDVIKTRLWGFSSQRELTDFLLRTSSEGTQNAIYHAVSRPATSWVADIHWYRSQLGMYMLPFTVLAAIPGFVLMLRAALNLGRDVNCNLWTLVADTCDVSDQYDMLSLEIYPWMTVSGTWLGFLSSGMFARLFASPFPRFRSAFYQVFHEPIERWSQDEEKWRIQSLTWEMISIPALLGISAYSGYRSIELVDHYARDIGCQSLTHLLDVVFSNRLNNTDHVCSAGQIGLAISGFLGDLEIGKIYTLYAATRTISYLVGFMLERLSCLRKESTKRYMEQLLEQLKKIHTNSWKVAGVSCLMAVVTFAVVAKRLADAVLQEGLEETYPLAGLHPFNGTTPHFDNTTISRLEHLICPYDQLDLSNITLSTNASLPIYLVNNATLVFSLAAGCQDSGIVSVYFRSLLNNINDCSPPVIARGIGVFISDFWVSVSGTTGVTYLIASALQVGIKGLSTLIDYLKKACRESMPEDHTAYARLPESAEEKPQPQGCLHRFYHFFKKPAPVMRDAPQEERTIRMTL
jgi:hypothetical protein